MEWLNEAFLATVLQGGEDHEPRVTVTKYSAQLAVAAGNNYNSYLYRVQVQYKVGESSEKSTVVIVKVPLTQGFFTEKAVSETSQEFDFFSLEPKVYNELLPKMKEKIHCEFGPKSFYCPIKNGLILQDLKEEGYIMCDKHKQLDYSHCKFAFNTLAKYHATSVACYHDNPTFIKTLGQEYLYADGKPIAATLKPWIEYAVKTIGGVVSEMSGFNNETADFLLNRVHHIWESAKKMCKPKTGGLNVLNHGDLWVNNMLFKYDNSGQVIDVMFVDFQIPRFASPVLDLIFFMWTSASEDVLTNRQQDLYDTYLQTLNLTLEQLGCVERLRREELQEELKSASDWVLITLCYERPLMLALPDEAISMEEVNEETFKSGQTIDKFQKMYNGKLYKRLLPAALRQYKAWFCS